MKRGEQIQKNVSGPSNTPGELGQNVSKKIPFGRIIPPFSSKVPNLTFFSIIDMIRIRFFGLGELIQRTFRAARYKAAPKNNDIDLGSHGGSQRLVRRRTPILTGQVAPTWTDNWGNGSALHKLMITRFHAQYSWSSRST